MRITVDRTDFRNAVKALAPAMSDAKAPNRACISFKTIDDGKTLELVATCGAWLARWRIETIAGDTRDDQCLLPALDVPRVQSWLRGMPKGGAIEIDFAGVLLANCTETRFTPLAAEFPPYEQLIAMVEPEPEVPAPRTVALNGAYLNVISKAFALAGCAPVMRFGGELGAVWIHGGGSGWCPLVAVLMPVTQKARTE